MDRITNPGANPDRRNFSEGSTDRPATAVTAHWLNGVQDELMAVITAAGLTPAPDDNEQLLAAIRQLAGGGGGLIGVQRFETSGTYTPSPGTKKIIVEMVGAGGGTQWLDDDEEAISSGGPSGRYVELMLLSVPGSLTVSVGAGTVSDGGTTSLSGTDGTGAALSIYATGSTAAGSRHDPTPYPITYSYIPLVSSIHGSNVVPASLTIIRTINGAQGEPGVFTQQQGIAGAGASSPLGTGGGRTVIKRGNTGITPSQPGGPGAGASGYYRPTGHFESSAVRAKGGDGLVIIWEYS